MASKIAWAEEVQELIKESGLTMTEVASELEIPYRTLQNWKNGQREPDAFTKKAFRHFVKQLSKSDRQK